MDYVKMDETKENSAKKYIFLCKEGSLLPDRKMVKCPNPKISIIIPLLNEEKNLLKAIRSIQNQSLQEIEIICINDYSNDKTLSMLESFQKEDPRIVIITNKYNRGDIYNRIYGAIQSKGEYIAFMDAKDCLCNAEILEKAYDYATKKYNEKMEIIQYQTCGCSLNEKGDTEPFAILTFNPFNFDKIIKAPEIGDNFWKKKDKIAGSWFVFDKIYSRDLILRVGDYLGPHIWNENLLFADDLLLTFGAMKCAKSLVNINDVGCWHFMESTSNPIWDLDGDRLKEPNKTNKKLGDYIIILSRILELTKNEKETGEFREEILKSLLKDEYINAFARSIQYDKLINLFEKLYNWQYVTEDAKKRIKSYVKKILEYRLEPEKKYAYLLK